MTLSAEILADSPIGYWPLDDTSGTTAVDTSGNGRNGTYTNGPSLNNTVAPFQAPLFDGSNDYVTIPDAGQVFTGTSLTVEAWINTTGSGLATVFAKYNTLATNTKWNLRRGLTAHKAHFYSDRITSGANATSSANVDDGTWHQLVGKFNGSSTELYVDGVSVATNSGGSGSFYAATAGTQPLTIASYDGGSEFFNGYIVHCAVFTSLLSSARILAHYQAVYPPANPAKVMPAIAQRGFF